ncbi:MAG: NAD-dependent epimerase/dehydratase family protein, partial [bacterium]|nr:NAD-dependent epimerase/dehydratase family protein [bacterium]
GEAIKRIFSEVAPDIVCHLAARAGVRPSIEEPILYEEVNSLGTLNMLEASRGAKLKNFVFAGSSSVYGLNSKIPFSEDDPITKPISPYASTKRASELQCFTYSHLYDIPITSLRFFTVYGEAGRPEMAVARFTRLIYDGKPIDVYGDGSALRDFTYVGDIIDGVVRAVDTPFDYEIINIGGSRVIELSYLIEVIEAALGKKAEINYMDAAPGDVPITSADVSKAKRLIGFEPRVGIEEGIRRYVAWFLKREERSA